MENQFTVDELKTRLDKFLAKKLPEVSRSQIQRDIEAGLVTVNDKKVAESKYVVRLNDAIVYSQSQISNLKSEIQPTNTPLKVLYHDHGLLIIDKPAGLVVHPGAGFKGETLASALLYQFKGIHVVGEEHRPGIVHRLDKDTSGVILVATIQEMYEHLKNAFAERKIKKEYIALVKGRVEKPHGFIETSIGKSKTDFRKQSVFYEIRNGRNTKEKTGVKDALTEYKVLEYLSSEKSEGSEKSDKSDTPGNPINPTSDYSGSLMNTGQNYKKASQKSVDSYTLLMVKLHTGRTHQIRVHMQSIGHPLMGDELYGSKKSHLPGLNRQFLHAKKIEVQLPDKTWIEAESELADDLKEVLQKLHSKIANQL